MVTVRAATIEDCRAIATVRVRTWRAAYRGLMDERLLARLDVDRETESRVQRWEEHTADPLTAQFVAEGDGAVVGFAAVGPPLEPGLPDHGQVYAVYALPEQWSRGVGHALLLTAEQALRDRGFHQAVLYVLDRNDRAARFYDRHCWRESGITVADDRFAGGLDVPALVEHQRVRDLSEDCR